MGRQPFRQMKTNATAKSADESASVTLPGHGVNISRTPDSNVSSIQNAMIPVSPVSGTNSFGSTDFFYFARRIWFVPMYSACGGVIEHLIPYSAGENGVADTDDWKFAIYDNGNDGLPKTLISNTMQWTPDSSYNPTYLDVTNTSGGELTLDADRWYWWAALGASTSNGGNIPMGSYSMNRGYQTQVPCASGTPFGVLYWSAGSRTSFDTPLNMVANSTEFRSMSENNVPRWFFQYKIESDFGFKGA